MPVSSAPSIPSRPRSSLVIRDQNVEPRFSVLSHLTFYGEFKLFMGLGFNRLMSFTTTSTYRLYIFIHIVASSCTPTLGAYEVSGTDGFDQ